MRATETPGVSALVREAALDLGHLIGQHVKVAQLELKVELHAMGRRACVLALLATLVALGYALAMAGLAIVIGGNRAVGIPLVAIGLVHVAGAGVGLLLAPLRKRGAHLMNTSTTAMTRSLEVLQEPTPPTVERRHAP
jgi:hypothetical protein